MSHQRNDHPPRTATSASTTSTSHASRQPVCCICDVRNKTRLIRCTTCNVYVHEECYVFPSTFDPLSPWQCDPCIDEENEVECVICGKERGKAVMKRTEQYREELHEYAHVVCGIWIPDTEVSDTAILYISHIPSDRYRLKCSICHIPGACVQCYHDKCYVSFHAYCARKEGWKLMCCHTPPVYAEESYHIACVAFCSQHRDTPFDATLYADTLRRDIARTEKKNKKVRTTNRSQQRKMTKVKKPETNSMLSPSRKERRMESTSATSSPRTTRSEQEQIGATILSMADTRNKTSRELREMYHVLSKVDREMGVKTIKEEHVKKKRKRAQTSSSYLSRRSNKRKRAKTSKPVPVEVPASSSDSEPFLVPTLPQFKTKRQRSIVHSPLTSPSPIIDMTLQDDVQRDSANVGDETDSDVELLPSILGDETCPISSEGPMTDCFVSGDTSYHNSFPTETPSLPVLTPAPSAVHLGSPLDVLATLASTNDVVGAAFELSAVAQHSGGRPSMESETMHVALEGKNDDDQCALSPLLSPIPVLPPMEVSTYDSNETIPPSTVDTEAVDTASSNDSNNTVLDTETIGGIDVCYPSNICVATGGNASDESATAGMKENNMDDIPSLEPGSPSNATDEEILHSYAEVNAPSQHVLFPFPSSTANRSLLSAPLATMSSRFTSVPEILSGPPLIPTSYWDNPRSYTDTNYPSFEAQTTSSMYRPISNDPRFNRPRYRLPILRPYPQYSASQPVSFTSTMPCRSNTSADIAPTAPPSSSSSTPHYVACTPSTPSRPMDAGMNMPSPPMNVNLNMNINMYMPSNSRLPSPPFSTIFQSPPEQDTAQHLFTSQLSPVKNGDAESVQSISSTNTCVSRKSALRSTSSAKSKSVSFASDDMLEHVISISPDPLPESWPVITKEQRHTVRRQLASRNLDEGDSTDTQQNHIIASSQTCLANQTHVSTTSHPSGARVAFPFDPNQMMQAPRPVIPIANALSPLSDATGTTHTTSRRGRRSRTRDTTWSTISTSTGIPLTRFPINAPLLSYPSQACYPFSNLPAATTMFPSAIPYNQLVSRAETTINRALCSPMLHHLLRRP